MSVSGSGMLDVLPPQPGENPYSMAYFCAYLQGTRGLPVLIGDQPIGPRR